MKRIKLLLLMVMSVVLVACGGSGDSPESVAKNFAEAMLDGDTKEVMDLIYISPKMQEDLDNEPNGEELLESKLSMMTTQAKSEIEKNGGIDSIETGEVKYNSDETVATVPVTLTLKKDGKSDTDNLTLIKTDDGWKVKF